VKISGAAARVARRLLEGGPATASQIAEELALTPAAVRRQLDALEAAGYLTVHEVAPFGPRVAQRRGRGRPAKICALTAAGRDAFEQSYDDVALEALRFMAAQGESNLVADFARRRSQGVASRYAALLGDLPLTERIRGLAKLLSQDGFAASVQEAPGGTVQLCEHHCPMAHVAEEFPEFCEAEQAAFSQLLGVHTVRLSTIASGANICTTHVPGPVPTTAAPGGARS
jgi:predicted ArsR family transcriptional regulator